MNHTTHGVKLQLDPGELNVNGSQGTHYMQEDIPSPTSDNSNVGHGSVQTDHVGAMQVDGGHAD